MTIEEKKEYKKKWYLINKENVKELSKKWKSNNKERHAELSKKHRKTYIKNNENTHKESQKKSYNKNKNKYKENRREYAKQWYLKNKEKIKIYQNNNKEEINLLKKKRYKTNTLYKLKINLRNRILSALKVKSWNKSNTTEYILRCDFEKVKNHLENKFVDGMNWDNHGMFGWHIDHIIPLASATTEEELYKLCHYTNLQPLWAEDNLKKSDKLNY